MNYAAYDHTPMNSTISILDIFPREIMLIITDGVDCPGLVSLLYTSHTCRELVKIVYPRANRIRVSAADSPNIIAWATDAGLPIDVCLLRKLLFDNNVAAIVKSLGNTPIDINYDRDARKEWATYGGCYNLFVPVVDVVLSDDTIQLIADYKLCGRRSSEASFNIPGSLLNYCEWSTLVRIFGPVVQLSETKLLRAILQYAPDILYDAGCKRICAIIDAHLPAIKVNQFIMLGAIYAAARARRYDLFPLLLEKAHKMGGTSDVLSAWAIYYAAEIGDSSLCTLISDTFGSDGCGEPSNYETLKYCVSKNWIRYTLWHTYPNVSDDEREKICTLLKSLNITVPYFHMRNLINDGAPVEFFVRNGLIAGAQEGSPYRNTKLLLDGVIAECIQPQINITFIEKIGEYCSEWTPIKITNRFEERFQGERKSYMYDYAAEMFTYTDRYEWVGAIEDEDIKAEPISMVRYIRALIRKLPADVAINAIKHIYTGAIRVASWEKIAKYLTHNHQRIIRRVVHGA